MKGRAVIPDPPETAEQRPSGARVRLGVTRGLYAILDFELLQSSGVGWRDLASAVLQERPAALQLRAKRAVPRDVLEILRALRPLCTRAGVPLFANDRPDLALLAGCDGVHVGQDDLPLSEVRRFAPDLLVGLSTHSLAQVQEALKEPPDYLAFGPVFRTSSKSDPEPTVGPSGLRAAYALTAPAKVPLVAIGGIEAFNVGLVRDHCDQVAVIKALIPPGEGVPLFEPARELALGFAGGAL